MIDEPTQNKDKSFYLVSLFAASITILSFKSELSNIPLPIFGITLNLLQIFILYISLMFVSSYFYGLEYLKNNISIEIQQKFKLTFVLPIANVLYALVFIYPLFIILIYIVSVIVNQIHLPQFINSFSIINLFSIITGFLSLLSSIYASLSLTKMMRQDKQTIRHNEEELKKYEKATELLKRKSYKLSFLELYSTFELSLKNYLENLGYNTSRTYNISSLVEVAYKSNVLTKSDIENFNKVRLTRNSIVHSYGPIDAITIRELIRILEALINKINDLKKLKFVNINDLKVGPIRHAQLTNKQIERIKKINTIFSDVFHISLDKSIDNFKKDLDPDREIIVWEKMGQVYLRAKSKLKLDIKAMKDAFGLILQLSMGPIPPTSIDQKYLTKEEVEEIINIWNS